MTKDEALKLEALENAEYGDYDKKELNEAISALREALAQPDAFEQGRQEGMKQERALWELSKLGQKIEAQPEQDDRRLQIAMRQWEDWKTYALELQKKLVKYEGGSPMILNTQPEEQQSCDKQEPVAREQFHEQMAGSFYKPPPQRPWVSLTKEEIDSALCKYASWYNFAAHLENILKEKNQ